MSADKRYEIKVKGIVQGVGFRPFIYTRAKSLYLNGWVNNTSDGVSIDIEGSKQNLDRFVDAIRTEAPPLSRIRSIDVSENVPVGYNTFEIRSSSKSEERDIYISPDVSICEDCRRELFDEKDRRYLYPFINCTNCGPRFTIIKGVPYDRVNTTMNVFPMCEKCAAEYGNPLDRRYHAQPVSCHYCGPRLMLLDNNLKSITGDSIIDYTKKLIQKGCIVAIKGLGGYHLACDANSDAAVARLRKRKVRDDKPFALMVKDYETALKYCYIDDDEKKLLESPEKPIVLLKKREKVSLPEEIAPGNPYLGIMLPYTPVHLLLLTNHESCEKKLPTLNSQPSALVMTSGNRSSEPIYYKDEDAYENLCDIADYYLTNDREIHIRTDDSVTRVFNGKEFMIRRSRGYAPMPLTCEAVSKFGLDVIPSVLACGGELKNTFCMNKGKEFYISHHIGDLENFETLSSFEEGILHFSRLFNIKYDVIAYDLHPEYLSTKYAIEAVAEKKVAVQHHHAHIASCMLENDLNEDVIGVAFDGTGYGEDGHIWGGEFFTGNYKEFRRAGHLEYVMMPGGEKAIKEPWRMALSYLRSYSKDSIGPGDMDYGLVSGSLKLLSSIKSEKIYGALKMMEKRLNSPLTSSMGRLFDAVSALIGIRDVINYEGQAAIEMEYIADKDCRKSYSFEITDGADSSEPFRICTEEMIREIIEDMGTGVSKGLAAGKFHETAANIVLESCKRIRFMTGLDKVVLSGGVFQNITLLEKARQKLENTGFHTYIHSKVPSNDAGISFGQAAVAISKV